MIEDFHPEFIYGVSVASAEAKPSNSVYSQLETMIMQKTDYEVPEELGMLSTFSFPNISLLEFDKARDLMDIGYKRTMEMMDSIKARVPRRVPLSEVNERRKAYKESLPPLIFQNIYVTGVKNEAQRKYIEGQMHRDVNQEFDMEEFKRAYFKMLTSSKIKEIFPHAVYNRKTKKFDLYLDVKLKEEIQIEFGGNISSYQANQLFLGLSYQYLRRFAADVSTNFQVGNAFNGVLLNGRIYLQTRIPTYLNWDGVFSDRRYSQSQSLFYEDVLPAFIKQKELYTKVKLGFPFLTNAKAELGAAYGQLNDFYYQLPESMTPGSSYDHSRYNLFAGSISIEKNTLNYKQYPFAGRKQFIIAEYVTGNERYFPAPLTNYGEYHHKIHSWIQMKGEWEQYFNLNHLFNLGITGELVVSSKNLLNNYTSSILQAPAFTPTPHSKIVFNEAFRANQYAAFGLSPIVKLSNYLPFRLDMYGFAPIYQLIRDEVRGEDCSHRALPFFCHFLLRFELMVVSSIFLLLPSAVCWLLSQCHRPLSLILNFGLNIGYLIFNPKMLD